MTKNTLEQLRKEVDLIDIKLQELISKRAKIAKKIAEVKKNTDVKKSNFYRPEREVEVLRRVKQRNQLDKVLKDGVITHIFREIMSACLALEQPLNIAYLGPEGTFTQQAALKHFGSSVKTIDCATVEDIFYQVEKNNSDYGVVPVENSSNGVVGITIDMLYALNLKVCGEVEVEVHHQLMTKNINQEIKYIYAHQQAFDQCRRWLNNHYPNAILKAVNSNALAARMVMDKKNSAAIASEFALSLYDLELLHKNIEDKVGNSTRFLIIGKEYIKRTHNDKTSLLVVAKHEAGALFNIIAPFKEANINILQLARHPTPEVKWEYLFFVDIKGHKDDKEVAKALQKVTKKASKLKILGSYAVSEL